MTRQLISKKTRNEFREFLVSWTLREIASEFEAANVGVDLACRPDVGGQRRSFVEQHYHTLDFGKAADVRRLLAAYAAIIERAEGNLASAFDHGAAERAVANLKAVLLKDGFEYKSGSVVAAAAETRAALEDPRTISEVTRRAIFDVLRAAKAAWWGQLDEVEFLSRIFDLDSLGSSDGRFGSMRADIWQHRENNLDWSSDWIFSASRLALLTCSDDIFLRLLCETVHPVVRPDQGEAKEFVAKYNEHLQVDDWRIVEGRLISGKPTFLARKASGRTVALPAHTHAGDVLSDDYVRELSEKCDSRLHSGDLDGAITVGRTLLEAILGELEVRIAGAKGDYKGDLPKQFKQVTKLLRMDDQRPDLDDRFKDVIRGLVMIANGLAPLRNKMSDGHARERKPAIHHARVVVNAAKTVSSFLVESYVYQASRGLLGTGVDGKAGPS